VSNDNSSNLNGGVGYYNNYYNSNGHHTSMDIPIQCASTEPTNTALGLQELGKTVFVIYTNRVWNWRQISSDTFKFLSWKVKARA
jgi:hypothetical protein